MEESRADEEKDYQNEGANGAICVETSSEETKQADLSNVETNKEVLQCTWIDRATSVDASIVDVEKIVSVCEVKEEDTDSSEQEDERCNTSVADR